MPIFRPPPSQPLTRRLTIYLTEAEYQQVLKLAIENHYSLSQAGRNLLTAGLSQRT